MDLTDPQPLQRRERKRKPPQKAKRMRKDKRLLRSQLLIWTLKILSIRLQLSCV